MDLTFLEKENSYSFQVVNSIILEHLLKQENEEPFGLTVIEDEYELIDVIHEFAPLVTVKNPEEIISKFTEEYTRELAQSNENEDEFNFMLLMYFLRRYTGYLSDTLTEIQKFHIAPGVNYYEFKRLIYPFLRTMENFRNESDYIENELGYSLTDNLYDWCRKHRNFLSKYR